MTTVNDSAPVVVTGELMVAAPPEIVWEVLSGLSRWPDWNPDVKSVSVDGPIGPGTVFRWKAGPSNITSTLREVDAPRTLGWTGSSMGIHAGHAYRLEPRVGGTLVWTRESWDGLLPSLLRWPVRRMLQRTLDSGLAHLKVEAERRASGETPS